MGKKDGIKKGVCEGDLEEKEFRRAFFPNKLRVLLMLLNQP